MNATKIHDWLEIVGLAAVVASLIFVGLQLKQSQDIAIAAQYQARHDSNADVLNAALQSGPVLNVWGQMVLEDALADPNVPDEAKAWVREQPIQEIAARNVIAIATLKNYDNIYFQYQNGFLVEEMWQAMRTQMRQQLNDPQSWMRGAYTFNREVWRESFREVVDEILAQN